MTRAAHRREPNSWLRDPKALFHKSIKLLLIYYYSIAISFLVYQFLTRFSAILGELLMVSLALSIAALIALP